MAKSKEKQPLVRDREAMEMALKTLHAAGPLTPARVVHAAKAVASPLHPYFEWDDTIAGAAYREVQAGSIIRSVAYQYYYEDRVVTAPQYVRDAQLPPDTAGYASIEEVQRNPSWAAKHMERELSAVLALLHRAESYATILGIRAEVGSVAHSVKTLARRIRGETAPPPSH